MGIEPDTSRVTDGRPSFGPHSPGVPAGLGDTPGRTRTCTLRLRKTTPIHWASGVWEPHASALPGGSTQSVSPFTGNGSARLDGSPDGTRDPSSRSQHGRFGPHFDHDIIDVKELRFTDW